MPVVSVLDSTMHYASSGNAPFVFLHGNPASSHIWRNVLPELGGLAPDLIGMGRSGKPPLDYSFADHARYLDAWFDALDLDRVVLVGHDWGGALAFDWAARHPSRVAGIAFFETMVKPLKNSELQPAAQERMRRLRTPGLAEELALDHDTMVRQAFTGGVRTPVSAEDLAVYLAPFPDRESRRPVLAWAQQLPVDGEPPALIPRMEAYGAWLRDSPVPKLLLTFENAPTLLIGPELAAWCQENIAALDVVACGEAGHHAQEDRPKEIAAAIAGWAERHDLLA
ncbi:haloalkane dehalogenase [Lentzea sp. NBC_00516]|uniref:haloalkane dehalogenase n=1 Tax=Lentzea sp. NBC_00516 TaxID=2903582 RepID=UPI002E817DF1|nr:haloalkane dehalogenase [Lentzea sp. NBC_00516]WUD23792.1 haloalkane dehalogenase [Lentzea sp. NBC_00516]